MKKIDEKHLSHNCTDLGCFKNQYKKGEMIVNIIGWPGIVVEGTRGNNPEIIPLVEMFGFEHETGSIYTNEVVKRLTKKEFDYCRSLVGMADEHIYFKGELIEAK